MHDALQPEANGLGRHRHLFLIVTFSGALMTLEKTCVMNQRVARLKRTYAALSAVYQDGKAQNDIPLK
ncbi:hypothetical protein dsmv_1853 [Desulfococcus multivorans DSM 2059]|jgi:hypothetical protein|uniref:Uncharacterized protein n=1 Tax=Desulfococcus multivorans DSM 2059 TaxID=1121405 RepID=S7V5C0_DESML|nr:hypothetical protein dsmv_1853 [Desulfococcus multivorans DSM 2059]SJZ93142.1 hypothetical protein SAMN02745446_02131 [Desulfococcus multivorans DSM 2059]